MNLICAHQGKSNNHQLWTASPNANGAWTESPVLDGGCYESPSLEAFGQGLYCAKNVNRTVQVDTYSLIEKRWLGDQQIYGSRIAESPGLAMFGSPPQLFCFYQLTNDENDLLGRLEYSAYNSLRNSWGEPQPVITGDPVIMSVSPAACEFKGQLYCFFQGDNTNSDLYFVRSSSGAPGSFGKRAQVTSATDPQPQLSYSPSPVVYNDTLFVFMRGRGGATSLWYTSSSDGASWQPNTKVSWTDGQDSGDIEMSEAPCAIMDDSGNLRVFYQRVGEHGELGYTVCNGDPNAGGTWAKETPVDAVNMSGSPSLALF